MDNLDQNQTNQSVTQPNLAPQPNHPAKKPLIVLLVLVLLIGGYTVLAKYQSMWPFGPFVYTLPTSSPTPTSDNNSGLKTYTSPGYTSPDSPYKREGIGYSVSYPSSWKIDNKRSTQNNVVFDDNHIESHISIEIQREVYKTVDDWINSYPSADRANWIIRKLTIGDQPALSINTGEMGGNFAVMIYAGDLFKFTSVSDEMLYTFKFTSNTVTRSGTLICLTYIPKGPVQDCVLGLEDGTDIIMSDKYVLSGNLSDLYSKIMELQQNKKIITVTGEFSTDVLIPNTNHRYDAIGKITLTSYKY